MTEKQSAHRIQLEDHAIREELQQSRRGQNFGFALGVLGLILATVLALMGHEVIAGIFGTTTIVGLVTVFVIGKRAQQKEDEDQIFPLNSPLNSLNHSSASIPTQRGVALSINDSR